MGPTLATGEGAGQQFVAAAEEQLTDALGFRPFHGTLNLEGASVEEYPTHTLEEVGDDRCEGVQLRDCRVGGVRAAVIRPFVPGYPEEKTEILAPVRLRTLFDISEADPVSLRGPDELWPPAEQGAVSTALDAFDAVVFDLDGTLIDLTVDWAAAREEIDAAIGDHLDGAIREHGTPGLFHEARKQGVYDDLAAILTEHELAGAEQATPRQLVDALDELECPIGVCTANDPEAADVGLKTFGAREHVDCIVGRDTVPEHKPEPEPLLTCLDELGVRPGNAVFIGDVESDAQTASRAGTSFLAPEQFASE